MEQIELDKILKFISESQMLKRVKREGFRLVGVKEPDSIAEHALIAAQLAYILAKMEGADASRCVLISLFHDNEEGRTGDLHNVAAVYVDKNKLEATAEKELYANLPEPWGMELVNMQQELRTRQTKEALVAKDADWLEAAIQAKIYVEQGHSGCLRWIENVEAALNTAAAKKLLQLIKEQPDFLNLWWKDLPGMIYQK